MERKISIESNIPVLGMGTAGMCDSSVADEEAVAALRAAVNAGITHIDTAEGYASGRAEEIIGKLNQTIGRNKLFITTKVAPRNLSYDGVISAAKKSLRRMQTNYVDLYLIHGPNPRFSLTDTMRAMDFLVEQKWARFIGVSNFSLGLLKKAQSYAKNKIVANQVEYSLAERSPEDGMLQYCQKNGIVLIAYSPLAKGLLAKQNHNKRMDFLCKKHGKTPAQIALNWLLSHENVAVIPKAKDIAHIKENAGSIGWELPREDIELLNDEFRVSFLRRAGKIFKSLFWNTLNSSLRAWRWLTGGL